MSHEAQGYFTLIMLSFGLCIQIVLFTRLISQYCGKYRKRLKRLCSINVLAINCMISCILTTIFDAYSIIDCKFEYNDIILNGDYTQNASGADVVNLIGIITLSGYIFLHTKYALESTFFKLAQWYMLIIGCIIIILVILCILYSASFFINDDFSIFFGLFLLVYIIVNIVMIYNMTFNIRNLIEV